MCACRSFSFCCYSLACWFLNCCTCCFSSEFSESRALFASSRFAVSLRTWNSYSIIRLMVSLLVLTLGAYDSCLNNCRQSSLSKASPKLVDAITLSKISMRSRSSLFSFCRWKFSFSEISHRSARAFTSERSSRLVCISSFAKFTLSIIRFCKVCGSMPAQLLSLSIIFSFTTVTTFAGYWALKECYSSFLCA